LLTGGFLVFGASDSLYLYQVATGGYVEGTLVDLGWPAAAVLFAWAAWTPSGAASRTAPTAWLLALPALFAGVALAVLVWDHFRPVTVLALVFASACIAAAIARMVLTLRENLDMLRRRTREAETDPLTSLPNRRRLLTDLDRQLADPVGDAVLALFDLNGFKHYNDTFGHPAGDALLSRLAGNVAAACSGLGTAYRMGGDEFCVLIQVRTGFEEPVVRRLAGALGEHGDGFVITASYGWVTLPREADDAVEALRLADHRMYANKNIGRASAVEQSSRVLLTALAQRSSDLGAHLTVVAELAESVAKRLRMEGEELADVRVAAGLHDVGKMAIPDAILNKPGPLDEAEWEFMRRHTTVGETIMIAAPSLRRASRLVRSSHERFDGTGYPDGLVGEEIPLGSRIVFACDAFDAMVSGRPFSAALTVDEAMLELRRNAGTQFDPVVVDALSEVLAERAAFQLPAAS
jgi:diguanylate cyclase (GGDEF)-like protein